MDIVVVIILVALSAYYLIRKTIDSARSENPGCAGCPYAGKACRAKKKADEEIDTDRIEKRGGTHDL